MRNCETQFDTDPGLAKLIEHTLLKPETTAAEVFRLCQEAIGYDFYAVCINPCYVSTAREYLRSTEVKICTVIGFPLGAATTSVKVFEAREAVAQGAHELDMVLPIGALKAGDDRAVATEIEAIVTAVSVPVKVILETALLTETEKIKGCLLAQNSGASFVKTSTGFGPGGATIEDIALMRATVGKHMGIKASGGIRSANFARQLIAAGASRLGTSAGIAILSET